MPPREQLWTPDHLAECLGVPIKTLYAWKCEGKGPRVFKVGRHLRYDPQDVEEWLSRQADERRVSHA